MKYLFFKSVLLVSVLSSPELLGFDGANDSGKKNSHPHSARSLKDERQDAFSILGCTPNEDSLDFVNQLSKNVLGEVKNKKTTNSSLENSINYAFELTTQLFNNLLPQKLNPNHSVSMQDMISKIVSHLEDKSTDLLSLFDPKEDDWNNKIQTSTQGEVTNYKQLCEVFLPQSKTGQFGLLSATLKHISAQIGSIKSEIKGDLEIVQGALDFLYQKWINPSQSSTLSVLTMLEQFLDFSKNQQIPHLTFPAHLTSFNPEIDVKIQLSPLITGNLHISKVKSKTENTLLIEVSSDQGKSWTLEGTLPKIWAKNATLSFKGKSLKEPMLEITNKTSRDLNGNYQAIVQSLGILPLAPYTPSNYSFKQEESLLSDVFMLSNGSFQANEEQGVNLLTPNDVFSTTFNPEQPLTQGETVRFVSTQGHFLVLEYVSENPLKTRDELLTALNTIEKPFWTSSKGFFEEHQGVIDLYPTKNIDFSTLVASLDIPKAKKDTKSIAMELQAFDGKSIYEFSLPIQGLSKGSYINFVSKNKSEYPDFSFVYNGETLLTRDTFLTEFENTQNLIFIDQRSLKLKDLVSHVEKNSFKLDPKEKENLKTNKEFKIQARASKFVHDPKYGPLELWETSKLITRNIRSQPEKTINRQVNYLIKIIKEQMYPALTATNALLDGSGAVNGSSVIMDVLTQNNTKLTNFLKAEDTGLQSITQFVVDSNLGGENNIEDQWQEHRVRLVELQGELAAQIQRLTQDTISEEWTLSKLLDKLKTYLDQLLQQPNP